MEILCHTFLCIIWIEITFIAHKLVKAIWSLRTSLFVSYVQFLTFCIKIIIIDKCRLLEISNQGLKWTKKIDIKFPSELSNTLMAFELDMMLYRATVITLVNSKYILWSCSNFSEVSKQNFQKKAMAISKLSTSLFVPLVACSNLPA